MPASNHNHHNPARLLVTTGMALGLLASIAAAQQPTTQPASEPYWLRVTANRLNVRSLPDTNSVVVARVEQNTVLRAVSNAYGWHRVLPPEGAFSLVAAKYISRTDETEGIVATQSGRLRVRVGSLVEQRDPLQNEVQTTLERGTKVRIIGQQGDWLRIAVPAGVCMYVSGDHVEKISAEVARHLRVTQASKPAKPDSVPPPPASQPVATSQPAPTSRPSPGPEFRNEWGRKLAVIEADIMTEAKRPVLDRRWSGMVKRLRPVADQREQPTIARLAAAWIADLEQRIVDQNALRAVQEVEQRGHRERARHERELERIRRLREQAGGTRQTAFAARGVLVRCFEVGRKDGRHWYKLQDPTTQRTVVYLDIDTSAGVDPEKHRGHQVGVTGTRQRVQSLGADAVRVRKIVPLQTNTPASRPARDPR